jgi:hypothetical protein
MYSKLLLTFVAALAVHAYTIPTGTSDGVYSVYTHDNGTEVHAYLAPNSDDTTQAQPSFVRRAAQIKARGEHASCMPGSNELNHGDCDAANNALDGQCGNYANVPPHASFYSVAGSVVAYFCNLGDWSYCFARERQYTSYEITGACGSYHPGEWIFEEGHKKYGYTYAGGNFCGGF